MDREQHHAVAIINQIIEIFSVNDIGRERWKEGTFCEIYCASKKLWFPGLIMKVLNDKKGEMLEVIYQTTKVEITKFDKNIRPLMNRIVDDEISRLKEMKVRYEWKTGSFCEIYSRSKKKWFKAVIQRVFTDDRGEVVRVLYGKSGGKNLRRNR
eukprot:178995_1